MIMFRYLPIPIVEKNVISEGVIVLEAKLSSEDWIDQVLRGQADHPFSTTLKAALTGLSSGHKNLLVPKVPGILISRGGSPLWYIVNTPKDADCCSCYVLHVRVDLSEIAPKEPHYLSTSWWSDLPYLIPPIMLGVVLFTTFVGKS